MTDGRLKMTNTTVADNTGAIYAGGVSLVRGVQSSIASSTITRNTANNPQYGEGGGIRCYEAPLSISGTEISLNKANEGGGINVFDTTLTLDSATRIANNEAPAYGGGGIYAWLTTLQRNGATIINNTPDNVKERT